MQANDHRSSNYNEEQLEIEHSPETLTEMISETPILNSILEENRPRLVRCMGNQVVRGGYFTEYLQSNIGLMKSGRKRFCVCGVPKCALGPFHYFADRYLPE